MELATKAKQVGEYTHCESCRFCGNPHLILVINLGYVPLAGGFLRARNEFKNEKFYPLEVSFCQNCFLLQSVNVIKPDTLFKNYFYKSSAIKTLVDHFINVADEIFSQARTVKNPLVVEIGSNDGTIIKELGRRKIKTLGIDPAENIVKPLIKQGVPMINAYFSKDLAVQIIRKYSKADIIFSSNTMAHIENMYDILSGIKMLLKPEGILIFEVHYLGSLIQGMQYDMIYHEHQYFYSAITLKKFLSGFDMEIFDVKPIPIHRGSMRYYVQNKKTGTHKISPIVRELYKKEHEMKLDRKETYFKFGKKVQKTKAELLNLLDSLKKKGAKIAGYGASGRGTIIMNYCGLDNKYLDYVIDDAQAKQGAYTPGTHLKIVNSDILNGKNRPDYIVLFAWAFFEEIKKRNKEYIKNGGKFIVPLPKVKIV